MFNFIGVEKYQIIRAQGNAILDRGDILAKAFQEAESAAASLTEAQNVRNCGAGARPYRAIPTHFYRPAPQVRGHRRR